MGATAVSPPRVVLDTGVVVSALVFATGRLSWLRVAWRTAALTPLISRATASELIRVLGYPKFRLSTAEQEALLADYLPWCEAVVVPSRGLRVPRCRDRFDRPFLALALAAHADALVSGDDDLLSIGSRSPVPIVSPAQLQVMFTTSHNVIG